jgi:hypothetical protein
MYYTIRRYLIEKICIGHTYRMTETRNSYSLLEGKSGIFHDDEDDDLI